MGSIVSLLRKGVLPLYRTFSLVTLYGILLAILGYGLSFAFYIACGAWAVPFIVNNSDDKVLALLNDLTVSQSTINGLQLDYDRTQVVLASSTTQRAELVKLDRQLNSTIAEQKTVWAASSTSLSSSQGQKQQDNARLTEDITHSKDLRAIVEKDLAAGLITKGDAQQQIMALDQFLTSTTDSKVSETLLTDTVRQHQMSDISFIAILAQKAQLETQVSQLDAVIKVSAEQLDTDQKSIKQITAAMSTAKDSPMYEVSISPVKENFAILPYNDKNSVAVGAPVYDCLIGTIICHNVGKVTRVFPNEVMFDHPLLHITMRGYVVKIDVDEKAVKSQTLVVGHKPFLI